MKEPKQFLSAEWRHLLMVNYTIDPAILQAHVPEGTELDFWNGETYVSLVGFNFLNTRVKGLRIPFHQSFEEINLRFYVRRKHKGEWRRGVVFIKEIVPKPAIAWVARTLYNENYVALPTRHSLDLSEGCRVRYEWKFRGDWNGLAAKSKGESHLPEEGSEEQFIAEHYWGYSRLRDGGTSEYAVEHPSWRVWNAEAEQVNVDVAALYGEAFVDPLGENPTSEFIAEGSDVTVSEGVRLKASLGQTPVCLR